jgi:hypothetical protein
MVNKVRKNELWKSSTLKYKQLANLISISNTNLLQFVKHNEGSERTIQIIQKKFEEISN